MNRKIIYRLLALLIVAVLIVGIITPPSSHPVSKAFQAEQQIKMLQHWADDHRETLNMSKLNNATLISAMAGNLGGDLWKYNAKGDLLDPWGQPYIISQNNGQITIDSPGLDKYNKLSSLQKWMSQ